jgi:hypothetical protein
MGAPGRIDIPAPWQPSAASTKRGRAPPMVGNVLIRPGGWAGWGVSVVFGLAVEVPLEHVREAALLVVGIAEAAW